LDVTFFGHLREKLNPAQIIPEELGGLLNTAFMKTVSTLLACA
jgi:hypothetical protein